MLYTMKIILKNGGCTMLDIEAENLGRAIRKALRETPAADFVFSVYDINGVCVLWEGQEVK